LSIALIAERIHTETASEFTPHITVLRDADKALAPCAITPVAWHVRDFALMHSQLGRERRYTEIGRWPLAAPGKQSK
jgi:2'-5' RNA ligase